MKLHFEVTQEQIAEIDSFLQRQDLPSNVLLRAKAVRLLMDGIGGRNVADSLNVSIAAVCMWRRAYESGGINAFLNKPRTPPKHPPKGTKFSERYAGVKTKKRMRTIGGNAMSEITCEICGTACKNVCGLSTHLLRKHKVDLVDYYKRFFTNTDPSFVTEKCAFCDHDAIPTMYVDLEKHEYHFDYADGYSCMRDECKHDIAMHYFGKPYAECRKQYDTLVSNADYISRLYRKPIEWARTYRWRPCNKPYSQIGTSLEAFQFRYGEEDGLRRYNERCEKIKKSMTVEWYIERFGIEEGQRRFADRLRKVYEKTKDIRLSKHQWEIFNVLHNQSASWVPEKFVAVGCIDMIDEASGVGVEYFGDYRHCNPNIYQSDFFNESLGCYARDKIAKDKVRLSRMLAEKQVNCIVVVWEQSFINLGLEEVCSRITDIMNSVEQHKKEVIWI